MSGLSLYLHLASGPSDTSALAHFPEGATCTQVKQHFCSVYSGSVSPNQLSLTHLGHVIPEGALLSDVCEDGDDIFVNVVSTSPKSFVASTAATSTPSPTPASTTDQETKTKVKAEKKVVSKEEKKKAVTSQPAPKVSVKPKNTAALKELLATIRVGLYALESLFFEAASAHLEKAMLVDEKLSLLSQWEKIHLMSCLGEAYFGSEEFNSALEMFQDVSRALQALPVKDKEKEEEKFSKYHLNTTVWCFRCLYREGIPDKQKQVAVSLLEGSVNESKQHSAVLAYYGGVAADYGKKKEAAPFLLRGLSTIGMFEQAHKEIDISSDLSLRARLLSVPRGLHRAVRLLFGQHIRDAQVRASLKETVRSLETHAVQSFLAQTARETGVFDFARESYEAAVRLLPLNHPQGFSVVRDYMGVLEMLQDYQASFDAGIAYIKTHSEVCRSDIVTGAQVVELLEGVKLVRARDVKPGPMKPSPALPKGTLALDAPVAASVEALCRDTGDSGDCTYKAEEAGFFSLCFALVRLLHLHGPWEPIPRLITLLQKAREGTNLHKSVARNENAYFALAARAVPCLEEALSTPAEEVIYVVGDSHVMSSAYHVIERKNGKRARFVPILITGLKCWHLRKHSTFFTKTALENALQKIPVGSTVLFIAGEIDCREGVLKGMGKGLYKDLDDACAFLARSYLSIVNKAATTRRLRAFVQDVPPTMELTRKHVNAFNEQLAALIPKFRKLSHMRIKDA